MWVFLAAASVMLGSHVRAADRVLSSVLAESIEQSDVVGKLVDAIEASDLVVYLTRGDCPSGIPSCLMVSGTGPGVRYIRINFPMPFGLGRPGTWSRDALSIALAHELQHAAEIAQWPDVIDGRSLRAAYLRSGLDRGGRHLDTDAAIAAGEARRLELRHGNRRSARVVARSSTDGRPAGQR